MKKFLLSIFAVLFAFAGVQAEEVTATITFKTSGSDASNAATVSNFVTGQITDSGGFALACTATNNCYTGQNGLKMSSKSVNGSFTLTLGGTYNVKTITVKAVKYGSDAAKLSVNGATAQTLTTSAADYTFDVNSEISQIKVDATKRNYIASISITYTTGDSGEGGGETPEPETPAAPTLPAACNFDGSMTVEITNVAEGATAYYSLNNETDWVEGTSVEITETTTVYAKAVKDELSSDVVSATYTKNTPVTPPAEGVSVIVFNKKDPDSTNALSGNNFVSDGIASTDFESLSCTATEKCFVGVNGIKMSSSSVDGTFTLNLGANYNVKTITVNAVKWGSDNAKLKVNGGTERNLTDSATDYVFDVNSTINQIKVDMTKRGYVAKIMVELNTSAEVVVIDAPTLTAGATFNETATVEITNNAEGTTLYYSYDDVSYEEYIGALTITETTTVYAYAEDGDGNQSEKVSETYTIIKSSVGYYVKVVSAPADWSGKYLIVYEDGTNAYVFNGKDETNGYVSAVTDGDVIKANSEIDAVAVTIATMEGGYSISTVSGYMYKTAYSNGVDFGVTAKAANTFEIAEDGVVITSGNNDDKTTFRYNKAVDQNRFRYYKSGQQPVQLYKYVEELPLYHTLTVTEAGYATLFLGFNARIPSAVEAYTVTKVNDGWVSLTQVTGVLPANQGVIIKAPARDYKFFNEATATADVAGNLLEGSVAATEINVEAYVLGNVDGVGLYKAKMTDGVWLNNANKAYLPASALTPAQQTATFYGFDWNGTTGVEKVEIGNEKSEIYDLTGRRVETITEPGIYIVNGVKKLVK